MRRVPWTKTITRTRLRSWPVTERIPGIFEGRRVTLAGRWIILCNRPLKHPAVPAICGIALLVVIALTLVCVDAFSPEQLPKGFVSAGQLLGAALLLVLIPPYLILSWGYLHP